MCKEPRLQKNKDDHRSTLGDADENVGEWPKDAEEKGNADMRGLYTLPEDYMRRPLVAP